MATKPWYYPHDFEASNDIKIMALEGELGLEGYARYFKMLEELGRAGGRIELSNPLYKRVLKEKLKASDEELEEFLKVCLGLGLFSQEHFDETGNLASTRFCATYNKAQNEINARIRGGIESGKTRRKKALEKQQSKSATN